MTRRKDRELAEELRAHLEMATRDRIERGEDPAAAAAAARREFGNVTLVQEVTRQMWGWRWVERASQDVQYAVRLLRRAPAFSCVAILSLAVGIGANAAIFQVINAIRLSTLPVERPDELAEITLVSQEGMRGTQAIWRPALTNPIWEQVRDHQQAFSGMFAWGAGSFNLATGGEARMARALLTSGAMFDVLGVGAARGRLLAPSDDSRGCAPRAVLSHRFWQREYGGDPAIVGRTLTLDSHPVEIVGVAAASFFGLEVGKSFDVAVPICAQPALAGGAGRLDSGTDWWLIVMGRLKPGTTLAQASAHVGALSSGIFASTVAANYPAVSVPKYRAMKLMALPAGTGISLLREEYDAPLWMLLALAAVVLVVACANLANLMLARATARQREIAIRLGLGASRGRVVRQLLTESIVLAGIGAVCGLALARALSAALVSFVDADGQALFLDLGLDWRMLAFTGGLAVLTCLLFGLAPAIRATRTGIGAALRTAGRGLIAGGDGAALRRVLVVCQVALSLVLIVGALLFTRTLKNLAGVDAGFVRDGIVLTRIDFRNAGVTAEQRTAYKKALADRLRALPGVESAAATAMVPLNGDSWSNDVSVQMPSGPIVANSLFNRVSDRYFSTFRTPMLAGRDFDDRDAATSPRVAVVNQAFAQHFFGEAGAVGGRFTIEATTTQPATDYQIVGVVANTKYLSLRSASSPVAYLPLTQDPRPSPFATIATRATAEPASLTPAITRALQEVNPNLALSFSVFGDEVDRTLARERLLATLSVFFGAIAGVLAMVGLYGVIAYTVARRTNEIGVRMALGARASDVLGMILREAGTLVAIGLGAGLVLAVVVGRATTTLLFGVKPYDPASFAIAAVVLAAVAALASVLPARAAARIQPTVALKAD
jgi:putative ABC transport system permease protein